MCDWRKRSLSVALVVAVWPFGLPPGAIGQTGIEVGKAAPPDGTAARRYRDVLDKYCVTCHNQRQLTAGLAFDTLSLEVLSANADTWERVIRKLRGGTMPPAGTPRPDAAVSASLRAWLEDELDREARTSPDLQPQPKVHRLNRREYGNAVFDLFGVEIDSRALLPPDDSSYGFDNVAEVLGMSPTLLEAYLTAATKVSRLVVGASLTRAPSATYRLPYLTLLQGDRLSDDLPFGTRGGTVVRHLFPLDGEYLLRIRLQRNTLAIGNEIRGLELPLRIDVRLDGARVKLFSLEARNYKDAYYAEGDDKADASLEVRFPVAAGMHTVGVAFQQRNWYMEGVGMSRLPPASSAFADGRKSERDYGRVEAGIDSVDIEGPLQSGVVWPPRRNPRIFSCYPERREVEESCAHEILAGIARRAYRRPVNNADMRALMRSYRTGRDSGAFDAGIEWALERILSDVDFLARVEHDPERVAPGTLYRIGGYDLASRLSFFLWSSIPDEELLDLAERQELRRPAVLAQQVLRMLKDERSREFTENFFGQWLYTRNMRAVRPDPKEFPEFDENLRRAFEQETTLFLESQLREDRSVMGLLTADYTFVNERLARHYGIPGVYGSRFRRVTLSDDSRRGLLGHGSVLTVTSYANRTSPVLRGKWLLENLLGTPPPAPPANVPELPENDGSAVAKSMRERMEQHRRNPVCSSCHNQMDPLGFALENFNGIGAWRMLDAGAPIIAAGTLPDGTEFDGPAGLRRALVERPEAFVGTLTEKLMTYALGRGIGLHDMPAIRKVVREARAKDYRWTVLIQGIVRSMPFQMRKSAG